MSYSPKNKDFQNDRIVSKLVAATNYKTRYEAAKVERTCVFYLTVGSKLEVPERNPSDTLAPILSYEVETHVSYSFPGPHSVSQMKDTASSETLYSASPLKARLYYSVSFQRFPYFLFPFSVISQLSGMITFKKAFLRAQAGERA